MDSHLNTWGSLCASANTRLIKQWFSVGHKNNFWKLGLVWACKYCLPMVSSPTAPISTLHLSACLGENDMAVCTARIYNECSLCAAPMPRSLGRWWISGLSLLFLSQSIFRTVWAWWSLKKFFQMWWLLSQGSPRQEWVVLKLLSYVCTSSSQLLKSCFFMTHSKPLLFLKEHGWGK